MQDRFALVVTHLELPLRPTPLLHEVIEAAGEEMSRWAGAMVAGAPPGPVGQRPSRLPKLGPLRKLRIAAAGTAGSLLGVANRAGAKGRWTATRRGCGSLICRMLVQAVCSTWGVRRSPRKNI